MRKQEIEDKLREELKNIVKIYPFLTYKYEFCEKRHKFLVSVSSNRYIGSDEDIWDVFLDSEQRFEDEFGMDAPLFTSNEHLFKLSSNAIVIKPNPLVLLSEEIAEISARGEYEVNNIKSLEDFYGDLPEYSFAA